MRFHRGRDALWRGPADVGVRSANFPIRAENQLLDPRRICVREFYALRAFALKCLKAFRWSAQLMESNVHEPHRLVAPRLSRPFRHRRRNCVVRRAAFKRGAFSRSAGNAEFARYARPVGKRANQSPDAVSHNAARPGAPGIANGRRVFRKAGERRADRDGAAAAVFERERFAKSARRLRSAAGRPRNVAGRADAAERF